MKFQISKFSVIPLKNSDKDIARYLVGFVLNNALHINGIKLTKNGDTFEVDFPESQIGNTFAPILIPINSSHRASLKNAIVKQFEALNLKYHD